MVMDDVSNAPGRVDHGAVQTDERQHATVNAVAEQPDVGTGAPPSRPRSKNGVDQSVRRLITLTTAAVLILSALIGYALTRTRAWTRTGAPITVSGWAPYWQTDSAFASFNDNHAVFEDLSLFAYQATAADVVAPFSGLAGGVPDTYRAAAHAAGVKLTASIIDGTAAHVMAGILADPQSRTVHVQTITRFAQTSGFDGIDLDYEKFAFSDGRSTWQSTRPNWVAFVDELAATLHKAGLTLTVSVPSSGDYPVYDYAAIGKVVDKIRMMAYDYSTSAPGPIAPISWVRDVVVSAKKLVPQAKLVLGIPVYGYDWPADVVGTCPDAGSGQPARRNVSSKSAAALAASKGIVPTWDAVSAERTFSYTEALTGTDATGATVSCTVSHVVWYADAQAVHARAYLAEREDLSGIAVWSLGSDEPQIWAGIDAARANVQVWPPVSSVSPVSPVSSVSSVSPVTGG
jgi:spore germination protein YaaH